MNTHVIIIGAGPAGLTAAYMLTKHKIPVIVLEADPIYVGGISRTVKYKDFCFDIGGHRFFSKSKEIEDLWSEILPDDLLIRPRSSRIFYGDQFYTYPLKPFEALLKLGPIESVNCLASYFVSKLRPLKPVVNFEQWVSNHFGKRLFNIFFKTYTEKVWGMSCQEISSDWAKQRIKGLSLTSALFHTFIPKYKSYKKNTIKTLIDSFRYPRLGPGMMWERCAEKIKAQGGEVIMDACVKEIKYDGLWEITDCNNRKFSGTHVISSAPLKYLVCDYLKQSSSDELKNMAESLNYRDFLIVALIVKDKKQFTDNWIYIHDEKVDVARIQNFKSWSPYMVPNSEMNCYGMEYFYSKTDHFSKLSDEELIAKAKREIVQIKLVKNEDILDACVIRQKEAYPVYDHDYQERVAYINEILERKYPHLYLVGRNGMHKYNNQDHAMMTAILTVKNILANERKYDVWKVNQDAEYLEEASKKQHKHSLGFSLREVPKKI